MAAPIGVDIPLPVLVFVCTITMLAWLAIRGWRR